MDRTEELIVALALRSVPSYLVANGSLAEDQIDVDQLLLEITDRSTCLLTLDEEKKIGISRR